MKVFSFEPQMKEHWEWALKNKNKTKNNNDKRPPDDHLRFSNIYQVLRTLPAPVGSLTLCARTARTKSLDMTPAWTFGMTRLWRNWCPFCQEMRKWYITQCRKTHPFQGCDSHLPQTWREVMDCGFKGKRRMSELVMQSWLIHWKKKEKREREREDTLLYTYEEYCSSQWRLKKKYIKK